MRLPSSWCALIAGGLICSPGLMGCAIDSSQNKSITPTLGRQLIDLKSAHEQGALNDEEYREARTRLIQDSRGG